MSRMPRRLLTSRSLLPVMQSQALRGGTKRSSLTGSEAIAIEAWRLSDRAKGRRTGLGPLLVGRDLMAGRAPPYGQAAPVRGVAGGGFIVVYCEGGGATTSEAARAINVVLKVCMA